jgi:hypothetical protein
MTEEGRGYTMKHTGRAALKSIELWCPECHYEEERSIDNRQTDEEVARDMLVKCPNCDHEHMERVIRTAPSVSQYHNPKSDKSLKAMQNNLKQRFLKKEADDVRHKHGVNFDDSLNSAAVKRIEKGDKTQGDKNED